MLIRNLIAVLLLAVCNSFSFSQNFTGKIVDKTGEPVVGSTIYIIENKQGLVCNENGDFSVTLPSGSYHCKIRCLGYEPDSLSFTISGEEKKYFKIELRSKDFILREVVVDNLEDPAYEIMRKAIERAPYHLSLVESYVSETYLKGSGKVIVPKIWEKMAPAGEVKLYQDKLFLQESYSEIKYETPDKYVQKVLAFSSTIPDNFDSKEVMGCVTSNLYNPMLGNLMSPLNPKAFSKYKFRYEGYDDLGGEVINKIKIIPKLKDPLLMEGYLYIAENSWDIRHAELTTHGYMGTRTFDVTYSQVLPGVYLPTSYYIKMNISFMGLSGFFDYLSSIKYLDIKKSDYQENRQTNKTNRKKKTALEIKPDDKYKIESDSLANSRDSIFWTQIRKTTLNEEEKLSYVRKDTVQAIADSLKKERNNASFKPSDVFWGGKIGGDSTRFSVQYGGLIRIFPEYNFVDGFWLGQKLKFGIRRNDYSLWQINPEIYWTTARKSLSWKLDADYNYSRLKLGELKFSVGSLTEDYSGNAGMLRIENALYSLFMGVNNAKYYENNYLKIGNKIDVFNGLSLDLELETAKRNQLNNNTTYSFFGKSADAKPNIPVYPDNLNAFYTGLNAISVSLKYTPEYYYFINKKGQKQYLKSRFPTFNLSYKQGVQGLADNPSKFIKMEGTISQQIKLNIFDYLNYEIGVGSFLNKNEFNYIDYHHFNSAHQLFTGKTFEQTYMLLDYYKYSTNKNWTQISVNYHTQYLMLKYLPFLQGKMLGEALHAKFLHTPQKTCYTEWGYSVDIPVVGSVGIFTSFDSAKFSAWGITLSFPLLKELSQ